jgi:hypothetical protein
MHRSEDFFSISAKLVICCANLFKRKLDFFLPTEKKSLRELKREEGEDQSDLIGRIFAFWVVVCFGRFLKK